VDEEKRHDNESQKLRERVSERERADRSMPRVYFLWVEVGAMSDCQTTQRAAQPDRAKTQEDRETHGHKTH